MGMELTNAERQAKYREKQKHGQQNRRLNAWVDTKAMNSLEKLAKAHGATQRQVLEALLSTFKDDLFLNEKLAEIGKKPHKVAKKAKTT
jgi:hypothetical protein